MHSKTHVSNVAKQPTESGLLLSHGFLAQKRKQVYKRKDKVGKAQAHRGPRPILWFSGRKDGPMTRREDGPLGS